MSVQTIPLSPPAFIWKFLYFHIISYFANLSGRAVREDRAPFFSYPPTASDETTFSVLFTIDVYHYLVIFDFIHVNSHLLE